MQTFYRRMAGGYNRNGSPESSASTRPGAQPSQGQRPVSS